jgi:rare lipoprotein A (peptidoglycan hydrolase)
VANIVALITTAVLSIAAAKPPVKPPEAVASSPTPGGAATGAGRALPVPSGPARGLASWYTPRPSACWDARGRHSLPRGLVAYTAHPSLPCGQMVAVSGPAGSITVPVFDHGPEGWTGRALDLSPAAFEAVAGNLWTGVVPVSWRAA